MRITLCLAIASVLLLLAALPLAAHHAFAAEFDSTQPVKVKGTIAKMEWTNPHAWLHIDVADPQGKVNSWAIELAAPNSMLRRGWNNKSIPAGTQIVVDGWQAKNGSRTANGGNVTLPDGRKLFVGSSGSGAPIDGPGK